MPRVKYQIRFSLFQIFRWGQLRSRWICCFTSSLDLRRCAHMSQILFSWTFNLFFPIHVLILVGSSCSNPTRYRIYRVRLHRPGICCSECFAWIRGRSSVPAERYIRQQVDGVPWASLLPLCADHDFGSRSFCPSVFTLSVTHPFYDYLL